MKKNRSLFIGLLLLASLFIAGNQLINRSVANDPVPGSCTIFSAAIGDQVLFGNNEDYYKPKTYLWTEPATEGTYGCIYLGFKDHSHQGGMNEKGLCFDANALPKSALHPHPELPTPPTYQAPYDDYVIWAPVLILRTAATVEEAIEIARTYQKSNWYPNAGYLSYQLNFADATGDAVVISVDEQGELAYTRKNQADAFLVSTNFNRANPENALAYPCTRYNIAEEMLAGIHTKEELTVELFRSILDSVHEAGIFNTTLYSNIFDLSNGLIYLYHWHQFEEVVVLNVAEELAKGDMTVRIKDLFSAETVRTASWEYYGFILRLSLAIILGNALLIGGIRYLKSGSGRRILKRIFETRRKKMPHRRTIVCAYLLGSYETILSLNRSPLSSLSNRSIFCHERTEKH